MVLIEVRKKKYLLLKLLICTGKGALVFRFWVTSPRGSLKTEACRPKLLGGWAGYRWGDLSSGEPFAWDGLDRREVSGEITFGQRWVLTNDIGGKHPGRTLEQNLQLATCWCFREMESRRCGLKRNGSDKKCGVSGWRGGLMADDEGQWWTAECGRHSHRAGGPRPAVTATGCLICVLIRQPQSL